MDNYCNYHNPEWCKKFDGLTNFGRKVKIDGNTLYIVHKAPGRVPVYEKIFGNLYRQTKDKKYETELCKLSLCNLKESTLIDVLESYGFEIGGK